MIQDNGSDRERRRFEIWAKSEDVAIHFNDLIMRWRLQAVGGLAALATLAGYVVGEADTLRARYRAMMLLSAMLVSGWVGVALLDLFYYQKLLLGAVRSIVALEGELPEVQLSTEIERAASRGARVAPWLFYCLGLLPLTVFLGWAWAQLYSTPDSDLDRIRRRDPGAAMTAPRNAARPQLELAGPLALNHGRIG